MQRYINKHGGQRFKHALGGATPTPTPTQPVRPSMWLLRDGSLSAAAAGFLAALVSFMVVNRIASIALACFGGITIAIAAITAAICTGADAHENPAQRYFAGIANGFFYLVAGRFVGSIVALLDSLP